MRWIFGIVGLLLGGLSGGVIGAFFGALIGLGLASLILYMDKRASAQWANPPDVPGATSAAPGHVQEVFATVAAARDAAGAGGAAGARGFAPAPATG